MGQSQSARKLTIDNDNEVGKINISPALAERLINTVNAETASESRRQEPKSPPPSPLKSFNYNNEDYDHNMPLYTITALQMQQSKERELASQENYWKQRLQVLKKGHEQIDHKIQEQYKKALAIFDDSKVMKVQNAVKPCLENKTQVLKCYTEHL